MSTEAAPEFQDYLVTLAVEQWCDGDSTTDEITLRVAGVSQKAAVQGAVVPLEQLTHVGTADPIRVRRDHSETEDRSP